VAVVDASASGATPKVAAAVDLHRWIVVAVEAVVATELVKPYA
jgi:hypothetical protein